MDNGDNVANVSPAQSSTKKRRCHDRRRTPDLEQVPPRGPRPPRRHLAQQAVAGSPCATACIGQPAPWVLETPIADRLSKRKKAWDLLFHRVARRANNKPLLSYLLPIPTGTSSQPTPRPITPFPCSNPGPRSRIPRGNAALRLCPNQGRPILLSPNTRDGPTSDQRARTLLPSPRGPFPDPPPPPSTPHGDDHHDPHDPKDAIISIAGPGTPPRRPGRPAKTLTIQLTSPRSSHLIECGIGPG